MQKRVFLAALMAFGSVTAQAQRGVMLVDWWDHAGLPKHVDRFSGRVWVGGDGSRIVVAVDSGENGKLDGRADHLFQFKAEEDLSVATDRLEMGTVDFWHEGLRVSLPSSGETIELQIRDTEMPQRARTWDAPTIAFRQGIGLIEAVGTRVEQLAIDEAPDYLFGKDDNQDYSSGGGSGGSCSSSCSITCQNGTSCSATCSSRSRAFCSCGGGDAACACNPC